MTRRTIPPSSWEPSAPLRPSRNYGRNLFSEILGTFVLVFVILALSIQGQHARGGHGRSRRLPVAMLIVALGMSLGGTTGYAINPARDLAPRLAHAVLPIKGRGSKRLGLLVGAGHGSRHRRIPGCRRLCLIFC